MFMDAWASVATPTALRHSGDRSTARTRARDSGVSSAASASTAAKSMTEMMRLFRTFTAATSAKQPENSASSPSHSSFLRCTAASGPRKAEARPPASTKATADAFSFSSVNSSVAAKR